MDGRGGRTRPRCRQFVDTRRRRAHTATSRQPLRAPTIRKQSAKLRATPLPVTDQSRQRWRQECRCGGEGVSAPSRPCRCAALGQRHQTHDAQMRAAPVEDRYGAMARSVENNGFARCCQRSAAASSLLRASTQRSPCGVLSRFQNSATV